MQCDAKAIGSGAEGAQSSLGDIYHKDITLAEATKQALIILKQVRLLKKLLIFNFFQVMEEKLTANNVELATVTEKDGFKVLNEEEVKAAVEAI